MNIQNKYERPIFLDNHSTTPVDPRVFEAMKPFFGEKFGNPHSTAHFYGWEAAEAVEIAREQVADIIGAKSEEIYFTSGATEANNTAIKGLARFFKGHRKHIVTCVTEHMCVLDSLFQLEKEGFEVTYLEVGPEGLVDLEDLKRAVKIDTLLVSIMIANNEIGTIQPIEDIGKICRDSNVFFHTDAAQAIGKIPVNVEHAKIDLLSLTAHKVYGPMGIGGLYIRQSSNLRLEPLFNGGGQEKGVRSGTLSTPLCVGMGEAFKIAKDEMDFEAERIKSQRDDMFSQICSVLPGLFINGHVDRRLPGNLNICIDDVDAKSLIAAMPDLALSSGSACTSASEEASHVLKAIGLSNEHSEASLRIGLGRFNTDAEIKFASERIIEAIKKVRKDRQTIVAAE